MKKILVAIPMVARLAIQSLFPKFKESLEQINKDKTRKLKNVYYINIPLSFES